MKRFFQSVALLLLATMPAFAADNAILRNGFSVRHERREVVGDSTRLYFSADEHSGYVDVATNQIDRFEAAEPLPAAETPTAGEQTKPARDYVSASSDRYLVDRDLIQSVIRAESSFNPRAVSPKGARGLMQLMPQTASNLGVEDSFDPAANVGAGTRYLRELLDRYHLDLAKALAAYNAGAHRVDQYHGVPPYWETRAYVARVITDFNRAKQAQSPAPKTRKSRASSTLRQTAKNSSLQPVDIANPALAEKR